VNRLKIIVLTTIQILGLAMLMVMFLLLDMARPASANDEPDEMVNALYDITIFKDLLVTGDFLAVVPYDIPFTTIPDQTIAETFIFSMRDGATENGTALAYPHHDKGYGKGIVSFYFATGTTWEHAYTFRVQENPTYYPAALKWDFVVSPSNYSSDSDQALALRAEVLSNATDLSTEFSEELISAGDDGTVLSTYGEIYFTNAIPGLQTMSPTLFSLQIRTPTYSKRTWATTFADAMQTKYAGTFIGDSMTGFAGMFSMQTSSAMNFVSIILFAIIIFVSTKWFKGTTVSAFLDGYGVLLLLMLCGFFSMIYAGLIAFLAIALGGVVLFLNRS
jgi:hypothetical protein